MRMSGTLGSWVPYVAHYPYLLLGALGIQALQLCERGMELVSVIQFQIYEAARMLQKAASLGQMSALLDLLSLGLAGQFPRTKLFWSRLQTVLQASRIFSLLWPPGGSTT